MSSFMLLVNDLLLHNLYYTSIHSDWSTSMSALRALRPRVLRPQLSQRYQWLRRHESTSSAAKAASPTTKPPTPPKQGFFARNRRWIWVAVAFTAGSGVGGAVWNTLAPPPLPAPGTREDQVLMNDLNNRIDEEFKVKVLRGKCLGVAKQLKGAEGGWVELVPPATDAMEQDGAQVAPGEKKGMLHTLRGFKGLGVERVFWDRGEQRLVAIVWFGGSISGWPGVTHGGVIATQLSEKLALAATLAQSSHAHIAAATPQRMPGTGNHAKMLLPASEISDEPAQLSLSYVKPTYANGFYVIRVAASAPIDQDPEHIVPSEPAGGHEYEATLESMDARVLVKAKGKFKPSSPLQRAEGKVKDAVSGSYETFREWMWPSRQKALE